MFVAIAVIVGLIIGFIIGSYIMFFKMKIENVKLSEQIRSQELVSDQMSEKFENLAQRIFEEKSSKISDQNLKNISSVLEPLREKLKDFEKKVEDAYSTERSERGFLKGELSKLIELNQKMSVDANNLTKALKGDVKTQGNWGEMILENILERSGLRKNEEYTVQGENMSIKAEDGSHLKPDVIVHLPEGKHIIVDSKMSLLAYNNYISAENDEQKLLAARQHVESIKKHIDGLSSKKYYDAEKIISPDFVILFMPLEPAFALAFKEKPDLLQMAWEKNIAIVSPTTLLTTLRTVSALWKQDRQTKNALEIAKRGGALYDKFYAVIKDFDAVGDKIMLAQKSHGEMMNKLKDGPGNLMRQVEMLKELGAKTEKKLID